MIEGGGGSARFEAVPAQVEACGRTLRGEAHRVASARVYRPVAGLVEAAGVEAAAAGFRAAWDEPLRQWEHSLASLGDAAVASGVAIANTDAAFAEGWATMRAAMGR